jgi:hypothetical protein
VVVEARPFLSATESTAMIIIGLLLTLVVLAFLCWVLFQLAVYALPFFAGLSLGLALMHNGAGPLISIACGILASAATLVAGQLIFTSAPSPTRARWR